MNKICSKENEVFMQRKTARAVPSHTSLTLQKDTHKIESCTLSTSSYPLSGIRDTWDITLVPRTAAQGLRVQYIASDS